MELFSSDMLSEDRCVAQSERESGAEAESDVRVARSRRDRRDQPLAIPSHRLQLHRMDLYRQSTAQIRNAVSLLSHSPHMYEEFIAKNASAVSQIESGLRSLTYIIPGSLLYPVS